MFLSPVLSYSQFPRHTPTSWTNVWGNRWMIFLIMIGSGLIKMRGDSCWRDLTCMNYHYEGPPTVAKRDSDLSCVSVFSLSEGNQKEEEEEEEKRRQSLVEQELLLDNVYRLVRELFDDNPHQHITY
uniref:Lipase maturation factor n=1 Tax=Amphimedon queenslandica TaxID=400682 RepID=A0A1X7U975_AMPQE